MIDRSSISVRVRWRFTFEISGTKDLQTFFHFADSSGILTRDLDIGRSTIGDTSVGCIVTIADSSAGITQEALRLLREVQGVEYVRDIS